MKHTFIGLIASALLCTTAAPAFAIVGGEKVKNDEAAFTVALLNTKYGNNAFSTQFCAGVLIDEKWVLTAAQCVEEYVDRPKMLEKLRVLAGRNDLRDASAGEQRGVKRVILHPRFDSSGLYNDIALLELKRKLTLNIDPIKLPEIDLVDTLEKVGKSVSATGWGAVNQGGNIYRKDMRQINLDIYSNKYCNKINDYDDLPFKATNLCAGDKTAVNGTCANDGGGPLFALYQGYPYVIGIISASTDAEGVCAKKTEASAFTRVSKFNEWIKKHTGIK